MIHACEFIATPIATYTQTINQTARERMGEYQPLTFLEVFWLAMRAPATVACVHHWRPTSLLCTGLPSFPSITAYKTETTVAQNLEGRRSSCSRHQILLGTITISCNSINHPPVIPSHTHPLAVCPWIAMLIVVYTFPRWTWRRSFDSEYALPHYGAKVTSKPVSNMHR